MRSKYNLLSYSLKNEEMNYIIDDLYYDEFSPTYITYSTLEEYLLEKNKKSSELEK